MEDKVQDRVDKPKNNLFHFSLVELLVVEQLRKLNIEWDPFLASTNVPLGPKGDTPSPVEKVVSKQSSGKEKGYVE
jgi:hypothetical protein